MTNFIETIQSEGKCDEDDSDRAFYCKSDIECKNKTDIHLWHGILFPLDIFFLIQNCDF